MSASSAPQSASRRTHTQEHPIWWAIRSDNLPEVTSYLDQEVSVNLINPLTGSSLLHLACLYKWPSIVKALIERGADVNIISKMEKITPIYVAHNWGRVELIRILLQNGAKVNVQDELGKTPLLGAAILNDLNMLNLLLEYGADPLIPNNKGGLPIQHAEAADIKEILSEKMREKLLELLSECSQLRNIPQHILEYMIQFVI